MSNKEKTRGKLYPSDREIELYRKRFVEGAQLLGRSGLLYQVNPERTSMVGTDEVLDYLAPVEVSYYLVERPKVKQMLSFGWNPEDKNHKPLLCYLTFQDSKGRNINPTEGSILELSARQVPHLSNYQTNKFEIEATQVDFEMNMFICNLVPYREHIKPLHEIPTSQDPINENKWFDRKINYPEEYKN